MSPQTLTAKFLRPVDDLLNRFTMYRVVLYGLIIILGASMVFAATGSIFVTPLGLAISTVTLVAFCYLSNKLYATLFKVPTNTESWLITALILVLILPPATTMQRTVLIAVTAILAMLSKYVLQWRGSNLFNPAAIAAVAVSVGGILSVFWWVGSPPLAPFVAVIGFLVLRKQRRFSLFFSFAIVSLLVSILVGTVLHGSTLGLVLHNAILSGPLLFLGTIMLTEPSTLPADRFYQVIYGALVGAIFASQLQIGTVSATPQVALVIGNIFTVVVATQLNAIATLKKCVQLTPNTYDLAFSLPHKNSFRFRPGQYLEWTLPHHRVDGRGNRRTFSIASSPTEPELHIGIKHYDPSSSFKKALLALKPGDKIRLAHLAGDFVLPANPKQAIVCIAGGIGITPFRSQIKYLTDKKLERDITLFYVAATDKDFVYKDIFAEAKSIGLTTHFVVDKLSDADLKQRLKLDGSEVFYISGPNAMVRHYEASLHALGVGNKNIHTDHFAGY